MFSSDLCLFTRNLQLASVDTCFTLTLRVVVIRIDMTFGKYINVFIKHSSQKIYIFPCILFLLLLLLVNMNPREELLPRYGLDFKLSYRVSKVLR